MGAQTMARFSAGVLSQLCATAQKTQTNEEAEASGGRPGIARPSSLTRQQEPQPHREASARGVGMTASESRPPGPPKREALSPRRWLPLSLPQFSGGTLHSRGSNGGRAGAPGPPLRQGRKSPMGADDRGAASGFLLPRLAGAREGGGACRHAWVPRRRHTPTHGPRWLLSPAIGPRAGPSGLGD
ncbi:hypothetical protein NN561_016095 [Cricetulus griseus]